MDFLWTRKQTNMKFSPRLFLHLQVLKILRKFLCKRRPMCSTQLITSTRLRQASDMSCPGKTSFISKLFRKLKLLLSHIRLRQSMRRGKTINSKTILTGFSSDAKLLSLELRVESTEEKRWTVKPRMKRISKKNSKNTSRSKIREHVQSFCCKDLCVVVPCRT